MASSLDFRKNLVNAQEELFRFAFKLTANRDDANDLLQETSLKALNNQEKYTPNTNFKGWVYTIMRNTFINNYRKVVRGQLYVDQKDHFHSLNFPAEFKYESSENVYDLKEIRRIIHSLHSDYSVPISMYVAGFKYREIADRLGMPIGTIKSRIFSTRQKLQEELKDFL